MRLEFVVEEESTAGQVLRKNGVSKRLLTKLKRISGGITLGGAHIRSIDPVKAGDILTISIDDDAPLDASGKLCVPVIYEDEHFIVFNKPPDMPVHPSIKHRTDTLGNYFAYICPGLAFRPINRLDRDTSGLCAVAKNAFAAKNLQYNIQKTYFAAVCGEITKSGVIDLPIAREKESIIKRCVRDDGQRAITRYQPIKYGGSYTLLEIHLDTGRTHQIRVHFSHIGFPLAGDEMYGGNTGDISRQALHCGKLELIHPITHESMSFSCELPEDIQNLFQ